MAVRLYRTVWRLAEVIGVVPETPRTRSLLLEVPGWEGHKAGQHVDVRLTAPDGYQTQRSYSIASAPEEERVELVVERLDDGGVSPTWPTSCGPGTGWSCEARSGAGSPGRKETADLCSSPAVVRA